MQAANFLIQLPDAQFCRDLEQRRPPSNPLFHRVVNRRLFLRCAENGPYSRRPQLALAAPNECTNGRSPNCVGVKRRGDLETASVDEADAVSDGTFDVGGLSHRPQSRVSAICWGRLDVAKAATVRQGPVATLLRGILYDVLMCIWSLGNDCSLDLVSSSMSSANDPRPCVERHVGG